MNLINRRILLTLSSSALGFFLYKTLSIYLMRKKYSHIPGPPTKGIIGFYLGNLQRIRQVMNSDGKILADLLNEWVHMYGTVLKFQVFDQTIVFTISKEGVKNVLVSENFPKVPGIYDNVGFPYGERFLGNGLITDTNSNRWKKRRAKINPNFHRDCLKMYINQINLKGDILLDRFKILSDTTSVEKTSVRMFDEMNHAALDIIASVTFGMENDSINDSDNILSKYVSESVKGFYRIQFEPFIMYQPWEWSYIHRYKRVLRELREIGRKEILNRLELLKNDLYMGDDMLTTLLRTHEDEKIDIEDMIDDFSTYFIAGQETTSNTLAFCFQELARHPEVLKRLRCEIDSVLGSKNRIDLEDLNKLNYLNCVYKETLRLWPPIPEIARLVDTDLSVEGYKVPKNTWIEVSTYVSARQNQYFPSPNEFKPERFFVEEKSGNYFNSIDNYTYFPFSLGPRSCIGQNFAKIVGKIIVAKVVKNFDLKLDMSQNFGIDQVATLRPADGCICFLKPRQT